MYDLGMVIIGLINLACLAWIAHILWKNREIKRKEKEEFRRIMEADRRSRQRAVLEQRLKDESKARGGVSNSG
jgi:FtsZ-interacting cell division protein ZipA